MKVEIWSDVVCPWCYIGKRRLERAMERVSDRFEFEVEYFPFELNTRMPAEGIDFNEYLCKKFGSESKSRELSEHVRRVAANEGLHFNLDMQQRRPNTRDAQADNWMWSNVSSARSSPKVSIFRLPET